MNSRRVAVGSKPTECGLKDAKAIRCRILRYLLLRGRPPMEGSSTPKQLLCLTRAVKHTGARLIAEVGVNAGYSTYAFLAANPDIRVVSYDLGKHSCTKAAKKLIDNDFPGRHTLIYGDSRDTVPAFKNQNPDVRFDLVLIDGNHRYEVAKADLLNMRTLCTDRTVVIMDDLIPWRPYGVGPAQAWAEAIQDGIVQQDELFEDGRWRRWGLGRYRF